MTVATVLFSFGLAGFTLAAPDAPIKAPPDRTDHKVHDPAVRARKLREKLHLTPAQEPALQAYQATFRSMAHKGGARSDRPARLRERAAADARFRAQLTSVQQARFDEMQHRRAERHRS